MLCCSAKSASQFRGPCLLCSTFFFPFSNRCLTDRLMIRPINNYYLFLVTQLEETGTFNDETHKRLHMHLDYKETFYIKTQCTVFSIHSSPLMQCDSSVLMLQPEFSITREMADSMSATRKMLPQASLTLYSEVPD